MVYWRLPRLGSYKCNSDGAVKGVGGPSVGAFCIRNDEGNLIHAESFGLGITSVLMSEAMALRRGLEHYIMHQYLPVILETDSLMLQKILNGIWEIPWSSRVEVKRINGTTDIIYSDFQELPPKGKAILHLDKTQTPNLRIRNIQNRGFNTQA
ncbi:hypothetical protein KY285_023228 [Solanum tuberosum]|nr:hypothetical protein KY285_023228 [Solanum tuberosum]